MHRRYFPGSTAEPLAAWSGLRVLPRAKGAAFDRPRDVILVPDRKQRPSWIGVYGGKLTGYRHTAQQVLHALHGVLPRTEQKADTATLRLPELERVTVWDA